MTKKRKVLVCCGTGCLANNSYAVYKKFKEKIKDENIVEKTQIKPTGCNGLCEKGPVVKILPDEISYFKVKVEDVDEIIEKTVLKGEKIERLLYYDTNLKKKITDYKEATFYKPQYKIALRNTGEIDPSKIDDYIHRDGYEALKKVLFNLDSREVLDIVEKSKLRGRGGAGFPTGRKWKACASYNNFPKYVVCNGDEGDPGAFMDRSIMEGDPNTIIEGMIICASVIKANKGFLYIRDEYELARKNMQIAINNARDHGYLGKDILGSGLDFDLEIIRGGGAFVCGEETALISSIEGEVGEPEAKYILTVKKGLWDQPTIVNNVETWANIPPIILNGPDWFKNIGVENNFGTKVFSLVGKVKNTGLVEIPMGTTLRELVFDIGGGIIGDKEFKAVQTGGPSGGCIPKSQLDVSLDFDSLNNIGSMMGSGGIIVMDENTCVVEIARYYMEFLSEESCGKCTTCREGIGLMLRILTNITEGNGQEEDLDLLLELSKSIEKGSLCGLGQTAPNPVRTTIKYFKDEYLEHINDKKCSAGVCKELTTYHIKAEECIGCGICAKKCPVNAIKGEIKKPHVIDQNNCISCGVCYENCPSNAITRGGANFEDKN